MAPTSAITESVNGIPTMANKIQKTRPAVVTGAMLPYPEKYQNENVKTAIFYQFTIENGNFEEAS